MTDPTTTDVFDSYWRFAASRQQILHQRAKGMPPPWTDDPVIASHRFTNAYRAADRVSQYLIREVAYTSSQDPADVVLRVLLFKLFNRVSTWETLSSLVGPPSAEAFSVDTYNQALTEATARGERIYSAAYIIPPVPGSTTSKHTGHLQLLNTMMADGVTERLMGAGDMAEAFEILRSYPGIGDFLAYQLLTDLNYTTVLSFSEMDFVKAGPGAVSGLRKCFADPAGRTAEELIRWTAERQEVEFERLDVEFHDLWGRRLQLIDCQNLFCEVDKYARVAHPEVIGIGDRTKIKQRYRPDRLPIALWFPPKWGINDGLPSTPPPPVAPRLFRLATRARCPEPSCQHGRP